MSAPDTMIEHVFDRQDERPAAGGAAALARLDALVEAAASLGDVVEGCGRWSAAQRSGALRRLDRLAGALATVRSGLVVTEQRSQGAVGPGDRDFVATRARMTRTGLGEARREVRQAETLTAMPTVADAVGAGRVPLPHLDALARVAATAGDRATTELARPETQARLVRMAERQSAREFGASAARLVASFDPAALERTVEAQRRERFLVLSRQPEGTFLKGRLDHLSAEALRTAIDAVGQAPDDERTKAQADADALVALAERATSGTAGIRARRTSERGQLLPDAAQDAADSAGLGGLEPADRVRAGARRDRRRAPCCAAAARGRLRAGMAAGRTRDARGRHAARDVTARPRAVRQRGRADRHVGGRRAAGPGSHRAALHRPAAQGSDRPGPPVRLERLRRARGVLRGAPHPLVGPRSRPDLGRERSPALLPPPPRRAPAGPAHRATRESAGGRPGARGTDAIPLRPTGRAHGQRAAGRGSVAREAAGPGAIAKQPPDQEPSAKQPPDQEPSTKRPPATMAPVLTGAPG